MNSKTTATEPIIMAGRRRVEEEEEEEEEEVYRRWRGRVGIGLFWEA